MRSDSWPPVAAEVIAVLGREIIRVRLASGHGMLDGGIETDLPVESVPAPLRLPGSKLWVEVDRSGQVSAIRKRDDAGP